MNKTLTKKDIVNYLNETIGLNKSESKLIVEGFFNEIKEVELKGFGRMNMKIKDWYKFFIEKICYTSKN